MSRNIILTVDDIPEGNTVAMTDYLLRKGIKPVFFAWGEFLANDPDSAVYALKKGIIIGNHTYTHKKLSEITYEEGIEEISRCDELLNEVYAKAGVVREHKLFRFPYLDDGGENRERYIAYLRDNGFEKIDDRGIISQEYKDNGWDKSIGVYCSFDCMEYMLREGSDMTMEKIFGNIDREFGSPSACDEDHIVLIHSHDETEKREPLYYERIIERFISNGARFREASFIRI